MTHSPYPPTRHAQRALPRRHRALSRPAGRDAGAGGGRWTPISFPQLPERVRSTSLGLASLGVKRGDRIAILSENRPEWAIADYACLALGAADVPIYPTLPTRTGRVHPARRRRLGRVRLHPADAGQAAGSARRAARLAAHRGVRRGGARAGRARLQRAEARGRALPARGLGGGGADGPARRPRHDHLHLGDHRRPEGRHADPREHHVERDLRGCCASRSRTTRASRSASPSCRSRTSSSGCRVTTSCSTRA